MTALVLDRVAPLAADHALAPVRVRPAAGTRRGAPLRRPRSDLARACGHVVASAQALRPAAAPLPARLYITRRGIAAALVAIAFVIGIMGFTVTSAFLAVSDAPLPSASDAPIAAQAFAAPGR